MAIIITTHIHRNDAVTPVHVCPGIRIHVIDIVQSPGIGIPPIPDMAEHQITVSTALPAKSSVATHRNRRSAERSRAIPTIA